MLWAFYIVELSVVSFFHFLLDHRLAVIESWVFDKAWEMIIVAKVLPLLFLLKFIYLKSVSRHPFRDQFISGVKTPQYEIWVAIVASLILTVLFTRPMPNPEMTQWDGFKSFVSCFSLFLFFMSDLFFIDALDRMYPLGTKLKTLRNFIYSVVSFYILQLIFLHAQNMSPFFGMTLFFVLTLHHYKKNWIETGVYLFFFLVPALSLLGLDFIWGESFSIFVAQGQDITVLFLAVYLSCIFYVSYSNKIRLKSKKKSEHISSCESYIESL